MNLAIQKRDIFWKKTRQLRLTWLIPCVVYGKHLEPQHGTIAKNEFIKLYKQAGTSSVVDLTGDMNHLVLIHSYQLSAARHEVTHVDFLAVSANEMVEADVKIIIEWIAPLETQKIGTLEFVKDTVRVEALPRDLPHHITVDVSLICWLDDGIFVKDLHVSDKVKILDDEDLVIIAAVEITEEVEDNPVADQPAP